MLQRGNSLLTSPAEDSDQGTLGDGAGRILGPGGSSGEAADPAQQAPGEATGVEATGVFKGLCVLVRYGSPDWKEMRLGPKGAQEAT